MTSETDNKVEAAEPDAAHMLRLLLSVARGPSSGDRSYTIVIGQRDLDRMKSLASLDRTAPEPAEPAQEVAGLVEKVARIIDADAFRSVDEHLELARSQSRRFSLSGAGNGEIALANMRGLEPRRDAALKTAKRILTALSSSPSQGGETADRSGVAAADNNHTPTLSESSELADVLVMTGCKNRQDLEDMANVGQSLMERIHLLTKQEGPFHNWTPADDPAEIVFDLVNHYEDQQPPADDNHKALVEAAKEVDRWALVIESAVRQDAPRDRQAVGLALKANSDALTAFQSHQQAASGGERTIYDQRTAVQIAAERAGPRLYHALKNLLDAVSERQHLRESIESATISDAYSALDAAQTSQQAASAAAIAKAAFQSRKEEGPRPPSTRA